MKNLSDDFEIIVNPSVILQTRFQVMDIESCLSFEGRFKVKRPLRIDVEYQNADLEWQCQSLRGMEARVFLHEFDHLEGRLICDTGVKC